MSDSDQPQGPVTRNGPSLYSVTGVVIGTFIGSLAAGVAMLYLNYRALGRDELARKVAIWGAVLCIVLIAATTQLPNSPATSFVMIGLQAAAAYFLTDRLQGAAIAYHVQNRGFLHSNLRAAGVGALTGLFILIGVFALGIFWTILFGPPPAPQG
ncbi:MAG: hypothetical protein R3E82_07500 [Pseudomonadales bacterium]|nr:hypothetical protein [Pseudomonadales bacterium]